MHGAEKGHCGIQAASISGSLYICNNDDDVSVS